MAPYKNYNKASRGDFHLCFCFIAAEKKSRQKKLRLLAPYKNYNKASRGDFHLRFCFIAAGKKSRQKKLRLLAPYKNYNKASRGDFHLCFCFIAAEKKSRQKKLRLTGLHKFHIEKAGTIFIPVFFIAPPLTQKLRKLTLPQFFYYFSFPASETAMRQALLKAVFRCPCREYSVPLRRHKESRNRLRS